jgi:nitrogenase iron protein NifH
MRQIAIYGKGGIGKSTLTANLSAALADDGRRVLQIGCDPKHDSTKLLLGGTSQRTVLELLKEHGEGALGRDDIVLVGYGGIACVEAGGPEPGVGCAGRGILSMAKTLDAVGLDRGGYDVVAYDVLGDVVCGGFSVPMRADYADEVYIVSSGEIMSL